MRSANGVGEVSMWPTHHCWSSGTPNLPPGVRAAASTGGSAGLVSSSRSTVLLYPSDRAASSWAWVYPKLVRRSSCITRADSRPRGETQSVPEAAPEWERFWIVPPNRRTAPTPTPVATAAARAWRRVIPLRTGGAASATGSGALSAMAQFNPYRLGLASARCEEFVSTDEWRNRQRTPMPGPSGHVRSVVRDGLRSGLSPRLLAPLHDAQSGRGRGHASRLRALGVRIRSRPPRDELGRKGHPSAPCPADIVSTLRAAFRWCFARPRWLRRRDPHRAGQHAVASGVGVARAAISILSPALAAAAGHRKHRLAACARRFGNGRGERARAPARRRPRRPAAHVGIDSRARMELGLCVWRGFLGRWNHGPSAVTPRPSHRRDRGRSAGGRSQFPFQWSGAGASQSRPDSTLWVASNGAAWRPDSWGGDQASPRRPDRGDVCGSSRGQPLLLSHRGSRPRAPPDARIRNTRQRHPARLGRFR